MVLFTAQKSKSIKHKSLISKDEVIKMLNLNNSPSTLPSQTPIWKVLVFDKLGQDIIGPLLKVNELRDNGITVHMSINSDRLPIPDVPAVYFIDPSPENIDRLKQVNQRYNHDLILYI